MLYSHRAGSLLDSADCKCWLFDFRKWIYAAAHRFKSRRVRASRSLISFVKSKS